MKIGLIGPGIMTIPPPDWGAVEILIWDYYNSLKLSHDVIIINKIRNNHREQLLENSPYCLELIKEINSHNFDFVHIHYDILFHITNKLNCKKIGITSHYPYINNINHIYNDNYVDIFNFMINNNKFINFVLASKDIDFLIKYGANPNNIKKLENGISSKLFNFSLSPKKYNKTIYLGMIDNRKCQYKYQEIENIDFVGPINCNIFNKNKNNYLGKWSREDVHKNLTEYGNLLLLSNGEADPLVVKEALICGLGVILNETSSKNLEIKDYITIIPDDKLNDLNYIRNKIEYNRNISLKKRNEIREYAINNYDINIICKKYIENITI